ncbi:hypothetical protein [Paraliobacillus sediminis]|uniref:hypothetical protein n=1 Tax=Paraliobacillus sediminis TaxID=1885916 RepID=UPI000E3D7B40|nr:hypothetical protein [Paraliobacillus sediminis]
MAFLMNNTFMKRIQLIILIGLIIFVIGSLSIFPGMIRNLIFIALFSLLFVFAISLKERVIGILIIYLSLMGFFRRALIPIAGWSGFDPLLIIGPSLTVIIALLIFWENKKDNTLIQEKPDTLMIVLFMMGCLQIFNPLSGSPITGLIATIYIIIPWLWYFIAFYRITENNIKTVFTIIEIMGTVIALYGIYQTFYGLLSFEMSWVDISGYAALQLGDNTIRAISTFPSAQEFIYFVMITFMVAFTRMFFDKNKLIHFPIVIITLVSIFLASSRTIIFLMAIAIIFIMIIAQKSIAGRLVGGLASVMFLVVIWMCIPLINPVWFGVAEPAVEHMITGLVDPLSEDDTGVGHINRFVEGLESILTNPVGYGITSITNAAAKTSSSAEMTTEIDISNMIVGMGVGGIIYIIVIFTTIWKLIKLVLVNRNVELIITSAILIGGLGQWINGGFYLCSIIVWLLVGWVHKEHFKYIQERTTIHGEVL